MNDEEIQRLLVTPLTSDEMLRFNSGASFLKHNQLNTMTSADDIFAKADRVIMFYPIQSNYIGHYTGLFRQPKNNKIYFFDSYGYCPDSEINVLPKPFREALYQKNKILYDLLKKSKYDVIYNPYRIQQYNLDGIQNLQTCGRHVTIFLRFMPRHATFDDFVNEIYYKYRKIPADILSCLIVH